jgi:hypothetical protein
VGALCCLALVLAGALLNIAATAWTQHKLDGAVARCQAESDTKIANAKATGVDPVTTPWAYTNYVCSPNDLFKAFAKVTPPQGIQGEIFDLKSDIVFERERWGWPCYLLAMLAPIPWIWYWFLRRLREVKDAVSGG